MGQNHGKKEWLLRFVGKHACVKMRQSLGVRSKLVGKPKLVARYLGAWEDADGCFQMDVSKRICAAQTAWHAMAGWFKSRGAPLMSRIAVFKNLVLGSLLTGLEASVLTDTDYSRLERTQMKWLRAIMGRCAFVSLNSGVSPVSGSEARVYHARSNQEVRELTRVFTIRSELLYRRLRWLQQIAAQPQDHKLLLAVVAGRLAAQSDNAFDERGTPTFAAGPWAHQWFTDLCSLEEVSAKAILNQRGFWSIFEHDSIFHKVDVSVVRVCFDRGVEHADGPVTKHACPHISPDGSQCTFEGHSRLSLDTHIAQKHNIRDPFKHAVVTNQCPFCRRIFKSKNSARKHAQTRGQKGFCPRTCRHPTAGHTTEVLKPRRLCCPFCEVAAATLQALHSHITSHFARAADVPLLQVQRRRKQALATTEVSLRTMHTTTLSLSPKVGCS